MMNASKRKTVEVITNLHTMIVSLSVLSSDSHSLNIVLTTDQNSTTPKPNRVDYPLIINNTLVTNPRQYPRFLYLATHKLNFSDIFLANVVEKNFNGWILQTLNLNLKTPLTSAT